MLNTTASLRSLQAKLGLPLLNQIAGWIIFSVLTFIIPTFFQHMLIPSSSLALASLFPFFLTAPRTAEGRMLTYFLSFCPCFVVLSIHAEGLFYLSYCMTLYLWTLVEEDVRPKKPVNDRDRGSGWNPRRLNRDDVRIALFFLFFAQVGFFGTGK
jgi:phosphatidylinositol glycan class N